LKCDQPLKSRLNQIEFEGTKENGDIIKEKISAKPDSQSFAWEELVLEEKQKLVGAKVNTVPISNEKLPFSVTFIIYKEN